MCFESFIIGWQIRNGKTQNGPWNDYWAGKGGMTHIMNILFVNLIRVVVDKIFIID